MVKFDYKSFLSFEEEYKLFDIEVNKWTIWPYIRFDVYTDLLQGNSSKLGTVREKKAKITLSKVLRVIWNCSFGHPLFDKSKKGIFVFSNQMRNYENGKYKCRLTDDVVSALGDSCVAAELISEIEFGHMEPVATKNLLKCDYIDVFPSLLSPVYRRILKKDLKQVNKICKEINKYINEYFGIRFNENKICERCETVYLRWKTRKRKFKRLFEHFSSRIIVETVSYSISRMIINEAAHELGLKVVELQHGVIAPGHIAYNFAHKQRLMCMPDYLYLFSDYWKQGAKYIQEEDHLIAVGFPYFDSMIERYGHHNGNGEVKRIIVISQHIITDLLVKDIYEMSEELDRRNVKHQIVYKLHPRESDVSIKENTLFRKKNVELISSAGANLYECFSRSDIQVGVSSSALFEGLGYGLRTFVMHYETSDEYMGDVCKNGYAVMVENGNELASSILNENQSQQIDKEYFFRRDALNNTVHELEKLLVK